MSLKQRIDEIFNILIQFEKIFEDDSGVNEQTYKGYLDRLYIWYTGFGNMAVANSIRGLEILGIEATHDSVKRSVFHMIDLLKKESREANAL